MNPKPKTPGSGGAVKLSVTILAALGLCACATAPEVPAPPQGEEQPRETLAPDDANALVLGAEVALQRGQYLDATRAYVKAALASKDEELAEQATRVAFEHQQWTLVQTAAEHWLQLNHTNEEARRFAAFSALHLYRIDAAADHLAALLDTAFINPASGFLALLPQLNDEATPAAATAVLQKLIAKHSDLTEAHYALAQSAIASDNFALALEHARKARDLGPYWAPAGLLLARVQLLMGNADEGLATAQKVLEHDNQDSYRVERALMLIQAGKEEEGRK
jgi:tetratricopeptide (TPR) repeat protein